MDFSFRNIQLKSVVVKAGPLAARAAEREADASKPRKLKALGHWQRFHHSAENRVAFHFVNVSTAMGGYGGITSNSSWA
jgi:hypothetical protein